MSENFPNPISVDAVSPHGKADDRTFGSPAFSGMPRFVPPRKFTVTGGVWSNPITVSTPSVAILIDVTVTGTPPGADGTLRPSILYRPKDPVYETPIELAYHGKGSQAACLLQGPGPWVFRPYWELFYDDVEGYVEYTDYVAKLLILDAAHPIAQEALKNEGYPRIRSLLTYAVLAGGSQQILQANPWRKCAVIQNLDIAETMQIYVDGVQVATLEPGMNVTFAGSTLHQSAVYGTSSSASADNFISGFEGTE